MRERFRIGDVIDGDEFDLVITERGTENISADATEAIDANLYCHLIVQTSSVFVDELHTSTAAVTNECLN